MSDTVHYLPGGPMALFDEKKIRKIPCGVGKKKWRDLSASAFPAKVTCARCLATLKGNSQRAAP